MASIKVPDSQTGEPIITNVTALTSQARTSERQIRTEIKPDGSITVYKNGEFRLPNGDMYVGETVDEKRQGRGAYTFASGDVYVGEFNNNIYHGIGVLKKAPFKEGTRQVVGRMYQGQWEQGSREGHGRYADGLGNVYEGDFHSDSFHGRGSMMYGDGRRYEGEWVKGQWQGEGTLVLPTGQSYVGGFLRGLHHGEGIYRYGRNNGAYTGTYRLGRKHGLGRRTFASGAEYEGEYREGLACGRGLYRSAMGDLYVGMFRNDKFHGDGTLITCTGDRYTGQFQKGMPAGVGRMEYERGGWYEGEFGAAIRTGLPYRPPPRPATLIVPPEFLPQGKGGVKPRAADAPPPPAAKRASLLIDPDRAKNLSFTSQLQEMEAERIRRGLLSKKLKDFYAPALVGSPEDRAYLAAGGKDDTLIVPHPDGKRQGKGVRVWTDGSRYEGEWLQDEMHGFGVYVGAGPKGVRYEGRWFEGRKHGRGIESYGHAEGEPFLCPLDNMHDGTSGRCIYDGDFQEGFFWGQGTFTCCDGRQYAGGWYRSQKHGQGRWIILPAKMHYGASLNEDGEQVIAGPATGEGGEPLKFSDTFRCRVHEGHFHLNTRHGKGKAILNNGDVLEGEFVEGKLDGLVKITFASSKVSYARYMHGTRRTWVTGPALEKILEEEAAAAREEEAAKRRQVRGVQLLAKADAFGQQRRALHAKVAADLDKRSLAESR